MKLFVSFSIGLLSLLHLSAGHEDGIHQGHITIGAHPEEGEDYWSYKFKMNKGTDWGVYHFHGKDDDSYFNSDSRVALHVSAFKHDAPSYLKNDCGMGTQLQRPIMKTTSSHTNKGYGGPAYIYAKIKARDGENQGELHLHDFVKGVVRFDGNVKAITPACVDTDEGTKDCEPECSKVKKSGPLGDGYYEKITIKNKKGSLPCGMHIKSREKTKGSDIPGRLHYSKDHFQKHHNMIQPQDWDNPKELWCLDRDCGNRARTVTNDHGNTYDLDCTDMNYGPCSYATKEAKCDVVEHIAMPHFP